MATKTKQWADGSIATIQYDGQGDGQIIITSDANSLYEARSMQITVETTNGSPKQTKTITINQAAKQRIDISAAVVTAANQTYSGSAKTPAPTVTLNGSTVPSTGYDVSYSDNTNAGTATVTITGKGEYTGTASGTFTIAKASRTLSFADSYVVLNTNGTGTKTATPSAGSGDGAITYSIANTTYATINSSTGAVTSKTSDGSVIVTATIAEGQNYLGATATYTLYVFATTHNYSYNGSYRSVTLPPGTYQFQCWGAQGGGDGYGYTNGGKGGYSVGQLTISQATGVRVYVGGQGGSSSAGYNGGGSTTGYSSYNSGNTYGYSYMGGGGGASDIRLSDGSLYSRMIVAGGGSGGAYTYREEKTTVSVKVTDYHSTSYEVADKVYTTGRVIQALPCTAGTTYYINTGGLLSYSDLDNVSYGHPNGSGSETIISSGRGLPSSIVFPSDGCQYLALFVYPDQSFLDAHGLTWDNVLDQPISIEIYHYEQQSSTSSDYDYTSGYAGGGTNGAGYSSSYYGRQSSAGSGGSFGQGANQATTNYRHCSAAGGGGWYGGGGGSYSDSSMSYIYYHGGGSGWVNTAASAGNRPSGYTGLQLDSGTTYAGNTSFPSTSGGTETGHSGNGYVRITRL